MDVDIQQIWSIISLILQCGVIKYIYSMYSDKKQKTSARDEALKCLLRTGIYGIYHRGEKDGFIRLYALENATMMYNAYHALGGNGAVTTIYEKISKMPHEPPQ